MSNILKNDLFHANISSMDNQVKMPKFEQGNFSVESERSRPEMPDDSTRVEQEGEQKEKITEPLVAEFEIKPEIKKEDERDEDGNGVDDGDDILIEQTFKGSKAEEGGTSSKVESLISKTDARILHKERNPYKFVNYWRRMKTVAMEEWFNRKIGEGNPSKKQSVEMRVGEGQEAGKTLEILQSRRNDDIQTNVVEKVEEKSNEEQINVVKKVDEKGGETAI